MALRLADKVPLPHLGLSRSPVCEWIHLEENMIVRVLAASLVIAWFAACAAPLPPPAAETQEDVSELAVAPVRLIAPTQAQLEAALSGDQAAMARAITNDTCIAASSCPPEFGSCAN